MMVNIGIYLLVGFIVALAFGVLDTRLILVSSSRNETIGFMTVIVFIWPIAVAAAIIYIVISLAVLVLRGVFGWFLDLIE